MHVPQVHWVEDPFGGDLFCGDLKVPVCDIGPGPALAENDCIRVRVSVLRPSSATSFLTSAQNWSGVTNGTGGISSGAISL